MVSFLLRETASAALVVMLLLLIANESVDAFQTAAASAAQYRGSAVSLSSSDNNNASPRPMPKIAVDVGRGDALGFELTTRSPSVDLPQPPAMMRPQPAVAKQEEETAELQAPEEETPVEETRPEDAMVQAQQAQQQQQQPPSSTSNNNLYGVLSSQTTPPPDFHTPDEYRHKYLQADELSEGVVSNFPMLLNPGQDKNYWKTPLDYGQNGRSRSGSFQTGGFRSKSYNKQVQRSLFTPVVDTGTRLSSSESTNGLLGQAERDYKLIMGVQHTTSMQPLSKGSAEEDLTKGNQLPDSLTKQEYPFVVQDEDGTKLQATTAAVAQESTAATSEQQDTAPPPQYLDDAMVASTAAGANKRTGIPKTSPFAQMKTKPMSSDGDGSVVMNKAASTQEQQQVNATTYTTPTTSYVRPYQQTNNLLFPDRDMEDLMDRTR